MKFVIMTNILNLSKKYKHIYLNHERPAIVDKHIQLASVTPHTHCLPTIHQLSKLFQRKKKVVAQLTFWGGVLYYIILYYIILYYIILYYIILYYIILYYIILYY